ncbi:MAG: cytochrome b/b6 domain-containing protein [Oceanospirillaceae bacterium]|nr:cytochrome b/b6 domain-containing protein [Oceanospirillaceae bacterium]
MIQVATRRMIQVWDLHTRIFHWSLASLFVFLIISGDLGDDLIEWHFYAGYLLSGLIVFRLIWGVVGSEYSRFVSFIRHPLHTLGYAKRMFQGTAEHHYGHNPAGGMMVVVLLLLLSVQVASGLVTTDDVIWDGPFYSAVSDDLAELGSMLHHQIQNVLQLLVVLHVAAIIFHRFKYKDALVPAMVHGKKPDQGGAVSTSGAGVLASLIALSLSAGWVLYLFSLPL